MTEIVIKVESDPKLSPEVEERLVAKIAELLRKQEQRGKSV